ncbi:MAG TPA: NAD-dependent epimerase/dehydratase family protein, partial [Beijerinckiaceae bacterium]|nr:NAD-dependent epimerase/dehydratase family protein [Beijerinckiaceae bacterium]
MEDHVRPLGDELLRLAGLGGREIAKATLHDVVEPQAPANAPFKVRTVSSDFAAPGEAEKLVAERPDVIFHLAAIVSGEAEADFDKGYRINLDGTRRLFEAVRREGSRASYKPRLVFASSLAVF